MTDHADTIRRNIPPPGFPPTSTDDEMLAALDALVAERQQAIDERDDLARLNSHRDDEWIKAGETIVRLRAERQQAIGERDAALEGLKEQIVARDAERAALRRGEKQQLEARCEQAIDALRDIDEHAAFTGIHARSMQQIARAALLSLGEQP